MPARPQPAPPSPSARLRVARHSVWLPLLLVVALLGEARPAAAQEYRRRRQRDYAADAASPAPAYGASARELARERRRAKAPVKRRAPAQKRLKNDSGDADAIEEIDTEAAVTTTGDGPETWWGDAWPVWDRVLDSFTPRPVRKHTVNTLISHRSSYGILRDPLFNAFGIDGFNNVGLGVRVGLLDRLDIGAERWGGSFYDTYEFDLRGQLLQQDRFAIDLGLRAGLTWFAQRHANDASGFFAELLVGRLVRNRVYLGGNFLFHSSSSGPEKTNLDPKASLALQVLADVRISSGLSLALEVTPSLVGYKKRYPNMTLGPRFITNRHTFSIVLSNTSYFSTDTLVANSSHLNPRDWKLGFHITREL